MQRTKFISVPLQLLKEFKASQATVLSYIYYRLRFNITFIESNAQIGKILGLSENGVAKIMRKLKEEKLIEYSCKRHGSIDIGSRADKDNQKTIHKAYCRVMWLTTKGKDYF